MNVVTCSIGEIVIDDELDTGDVDTARGDVGGDEDTIAAGFEPIERFAPLTEGPVRVNLRDLVPHCRDRARHLLGTVLGTGKYENTAVVL